MKIDNTLIISALCAAYTAHSAANVHIIGFDVSDIVFYAEIPLDIILHEFSGISMTSDEIPEKRLRVKPLTKKTQVLFNSYNPKMLCTFAELTETAKKDFSGNRGQAFEFLVCQAYGGKLARQNAPFFECGDFSANGLEYQVKFQNASIIKESQIARIENL